MDQETRIMVNICQVMRRLLSNSNVRKGKDEGVGERAEDVQ